MFFLAAAAMSVKIYSYHNRLLANGIHDYAWGSAGKTIGGW